MNERTKKRPHREDGRHKFCERCRDAFFPKAGLFERARFCSKNCRAQAAHDRAGRKSRGLNARQKLRAEALKRYGPTCVICKKTKRPIRVLVRVPTHFACSTAGHRSVDHAVVVCHRCNGRFIVGTFDPVKRRCDGGYFARYSRRALSGIHQVATELEGRCEKK